MITAQFKKFNQNYKYFILAIVFLAGIAIFSSLGTNRAAANSSAQANQPSADSKQQSELQTNLTATDPDIKELEKTLASTEQQPETVQSEQTGQVLAAQTTTTSGGQNVAVGYVKNAISATSEALSQSMANGVTTTITTASGQEVNVYSYSGAIPSLISTTGLMYQQRPVSVEVWANGIKDKISPGVAAQSSLDSDTYNPGQGYDLLSPIQGLWRAAVNLVYIFYILIVVGLAFLILFRSQLGGQEAVTLFNALPSLIISLVLVYFSYPISALFIDGITIGSSVTYGVLVGDGSSGSTAPGHFLYGQPLDATSRVEEGSSLPEVIVGTDVVIDPKTGLQIDDKYVNIWQVFATSGISPTGEDIETIIPQEIPLVNALGNLIENVTGGSITDTLLKLIFTFAAFSASLKLFFSLLKSYVYLIILPLASPFIFLLAAIPGQTSNIIRQYFSRLAAAALSFIAVYAVFLIIIIIARDTTNPGDAIWTPPLLGYSAGQTISGTGITNIARPLIGYALFVSTPLIPDYIFELFSAKDQSPFAENIKKTTQQGAGMLMGAGTFGWRQLQSSLGTAPQAR